MQLGRPCGSSDDSGVVRLPRPRTPTASEFVGKPLAFARYVAPSQGSVVAKRTFRPPDPAHPAPSTAAVAGHVVATVWRRLQYSPNTGGKSAAIVSSPFGSRRIAYTSSAVRP